MNQPRHAMECDFYDGLTVDSPTVEGTARPRTGDGMRARKKALREGRLIPRHEAERLEAVKTEAFNEAERKAEEARVAEDRAAATLEPTPDTLVEPEPEPTQDQEDEAAAMDAEEEGEQPSDEEAALLE